MHHAPGMYEEEVGGIVVHVREALHWCTPWSQNYFKFHKKGNNSSVNKDIEQAFLQISFASSSIIMYAQFLWLLRICYREERIPKKLRPGILLQVRAAWAAQEILVIVLSSLLPPGPFECTFNRERRSNWTKSVQRRISYSRVTGRSRIRNLPRVTSSQFSLKADWKPCICNPNDQLDNWKPCICNP